MEFIVQKSVHWLTTSDVKIDILDIEFRCSYCEKIFKHKPVIVGDIGKMIVKNLYSTSKNVIYTYDIKVYCSEECALADNL